jgi:hypothetical protein
LGKRVCLFFAKGVGSTMCIADDWTYFLRLPLEEGEVRGHFWQDVAFNANIISPTPRMLPVATGLRNVGSSFSTGCCPNRGVSVSHRHRSSSGPSTGQRLREDLAQGWRPGRLDVQALLRTCSKGWISDTRLSARPHHRDGNTPSSCTRRIRICRISPMFSGTPATRPRPAHLRRLSDLARRGTLRANRRHCLSGDLSVDVEPPGEFGKPEIGDLAEPTPVGILLATVLVWEGLLVRVPQPDY